MGCKTIVSHQMTYTRYEFLNQFPKTYKGARINHLSPLSHLCKQISNHNSKENISGFAHAVEGSMVNLEATLWQGHYSAMDPYLWHTDCCIEFPI